MRAIRIMANLRVRDVAAAKSFYTDYLGLSTEEFNMGWVASYTSPDTGANVQLVTRDATAPEDSVMSVQTDDVDRAYEEALELGYKIVHPITTETVGRAPVLGPRTRRQRRQRRASSRLRAAACVALADRSAGRRRPARGAMEMAIRRTVGRSSTGTP